jgi:hypothetical protein
MTAPSTTDRLVAPLELGRRLGLALLAGAVAGLVAGGIGGRLIMLILSRLNPLAKGTISDDGFVMGQFTAAGTANLLVVTTIMGAIGGLVWVALRGLRFGPSWWRTLSMPLGATLVIGNMMVHSDGIDFVLLDPPLVAVGLTLLVPLLATVLVTALGDRWIGHGDTNWQRLPAAVAWIARGALTVVVAAATVSLLTTIGELV